MGFDSLLCQRNARPFHVYPLLDGRGNLSGNVYEDRMLVDAVLYAGERDLLELRFEILKDKVDLFLVVEGTLTFTGKERIVKHDWCMSNYNTIHGVVSNFPEASERNPWKREMYQRNQILEYLKSYPDDTIVMVSDVDEIPNPDDLPSQREKFSQGTLIRFQHEVFHFNFNHHVVNDNSARNGWSGTAMCRLDDLRKWYPQGVRNKPEATIFKSGWHLSWMVNPEEKLKAYSHVELLEIEGTIPEKVQKRWNYQYQEVTGLSHLPKQIQDNPEKWRNYFAKGEPNGQR